MMCKILAEYARVLMRNATPHEANGGEEWP